MFGFLFSKRRQIMSDRTSRQYDVSIKRLRESAREQCFVGCFGICESCRICEELKHAADAIEELSKRVSPVVHGKWIPDYDYAEYDYDGSTPLPEPLKFQVGWQCGLCGEYTPGKTNFCSNCGADMREE